MEKNDNSSGPTGPSLVNSAISGNNSRKHLRPFLEQMSGNDDRMLRLHLGVTHAQYIGRGVNSGRDTRDQGHAPSLVGSGFLTSVCTCFMFLGSKASTSSRTSAVFSWATSEIYISTNTQSSHGRGNTDIDIKHARGPGAIDCRTDTSYRQGTYTTESKNIAHHMLNMFSPLPFLPLCRTGKTTPLRIECSKEHMSNSK